MFARVGSTERTVPHWSGATSPPHGCYTQASR
jgi:hypothetical protein